MKRAGFLQVFKGATDPVCLLGFMNFTWCLFSRSIRYESVNWWWAEYAGEAYASVVYGDGADGDELYALLILIKVR